MPNIASQHGWFVTVNVNGVPTRIPLIEALALRGKYFVQHIREGKIIHEEEFPNLVTTAGKNLALDTYLAGSTYTAAFKLGLKGTGSAAAGDTLASHAGWSEVTAYTGNRGTPAWSSASGGSKATSSAVSFAINGSATVAGAMLVHGGSATPGDTATGTLFSAGDFAASRSVINGDTLNVSYTLSA